MIFLGFEVFFYYMPLCPVVLWMHQTCVSTPEQLHLFYLIKSDRQMPPSSSNRRIASFNVIWQLLSLKQPFYTIHIRPAHQSLPADLVQLSPRPKGSIFAEELVQRQEYAKDTQAKQPQLSPYEKTVSRIVNRISLEDSMQYQMKERCKEGSL